MILKSSHTVALVLLPLFLITGIVSVLGYVWCLGSDGHIGVEVSSVNGCSDEDVESRNVFRLAVPSIEQSNAGCSDSGLDFTVHVQQAEATFLKRFENIPLISVDTVPSNAFSSLVAQNTKLIVDNLALKPPSKISQTILAHRTIVLLV
jgi:hypothetical protein